MSAHPVEKALSENRSLRLRFSLREVVQQASLPHVAAAVRRVLVGRPALNVILEENACQQRL